MMAGEASWIKFALSAGTEKGGSCHAMDFSAYHLPPFCMCCQFSHQLSTWKSWRDVLGLKKQQEPDCDFQFSTVFSVINMPVL